MPIEHALAARVRSHVQGTRAEDLINIEAVKGCEALVINHNVALEPVFLSITDAMHALELAPSTSWTPEPPPAADELLRLQVWQSPQPCDDWWLRAELFLRHLAEAQRRVAFEVLGNRKGVLMDFLCHRDDAVVVQAAFAGQFEHCQLSPVMTNPWCDCLPQAWQAAVFRDYYPPPPYTHLLTQPAELRRSPFTTLFASLRAVPESALGVYQVVFQVVAREHNWHRNIQVLLDLEYMLRLSTGVIDARRYIQQTPSVDQRNMAMDVETKAHNDKPLYAASLRLAVLGGGEQAASLLRSLDIVAKLIQHGGRPLDSLTEKDYVNRLPWAAIQRIFVDAATHHPGFLVNSAELASLVHIPSPQLAQHVRELPISRLETLVPDTFLAEGTPIGYCDSAGVRLPVCIPWAARRSHGHVIGLPNYGKSKLLLSMLLHDFHRGAGVILFDPHGDLVEDVLHVLHEVDIPRVVYFNPGDPEWVPLWNPLRPILGQDVGRIADDLVGAFKKFVEHWGDRLEHLLRNIFYSALCLYQCTLLDVSNLLRTQDNEGLRQKILAAIDNDSARQFWRHDFERYGKDDFGPPRNKLSKLLLAGSVSLMLSQPESVIKLHEIMDGGMLLLVDLSKVGSQVRGFLGSLMLSLCHLTALTRSAIPEEQRPECNIYCDEAHLFLTESLEEIIAETRKYNVSLLLAHQFMSQFTTRKTDALMSVGATIMFNVNREDAEQLKRNLQSLVEADDLTTLEPRQAIARIGTRVVRFRTHEAPVADGRGYRDEIIRYCHERYYRRSDAVRAAIRNRGGLAGDLGVGLPAGIEGGEVPAPDTF